MKLLQRMGFRQQKKTWAAGLPGVRTDRNPCRRDAAALKQPQLVPYENENPAKPGTASSMDWRLVCTRQHGAMVSVSRWAALAVLTG